MKCILMEQQRGGSGDGGFLLQELEITSPPIKISYLAGDPFDAAGMIVMGTYGIDGYPLNTVDVTNSVSVSPNPLTDGTSRIKIFMLADNGKEISTYYPVTVTHKLLSISSDYTLEPEYGDSFPATLQVTASYSDGATETVTATSDTTRFSSIGPKDVVLSYSENGVTAQTTLHFEVARKSVGKPAWKNVPPVYNGSLISVNSSTYWINYNETYWLIDGYQGINAGIGYLATFSLKDFYRWSDGSVADLSLAWSIDKASLTTVPTQSNTLTYNTSSQSPTWNNYNSSQLRISGETSGINAKIYTAVFTPTDNYKWSDGSASKSATWTIGKASRTVTLTPNSLTFNASNYNSYQVVEVDYVRTDSDYDYTSLEGISITPTVSALESPPVLMSLRIKGDGITEITDGKITVIIEEDSNYLESSADITVNAKYWSFGAGQGEQADAAWFNGLQNYLESNSGASLKRTNGDSIVGATKTITLTTSVLGTTSHLIRVIGVDQDGPNTVTWQTANCLAQTTKWSFATINSTNTTAARWTDSNCKAKIECLNYYKALPGYNSSSGLVPYIKTVKKGTCASTNNNRNETPTYNDETVWLPSEREMGLNSGSPLSTTNSTTSKAECTQGYNEPYSYYESNNNRIKKLGDNGSVQNYWERSRLYTPENPTYVCAVSTGGSAGSYVYWESIGLAPAFVVGN